MKRARNIARIGLAVATALASARCAPEHIRAIIESAAPSRALNDRDSVIAVHGRGFEAQLDERGPDLVADPWEIRIGDRRLRDVRWISDQELQGVLPVGLPPAVYDVVVRGSGKEAVLPGGFASVAPVAPRIDSVAPSSIGSAGGAVHVLGAGFHLGTRASVRGLPVEAEWQSDEDLLLHLPPLPAGQARIRLETPVGEVWHDDVLLYTP